MNEYFYSHNLDVSEVEKACDFFYKKNVILCDISNKKLFVDGDKYSIKIIGEIYGLQELEKEFKDLSDRDLIILSAFLKYKEKAFNFINGNMAIIIIDYKNNEVILFRDKLGSAPLYYSINSNRFIISSTINIIVKCKSFNSNINTTVLPKYLYHHYISAPDTIIDNVYKVCAGEMVIIKDRKVIKKQVFNLVNEYFDTNKNGFKSYQEYRDILKQKIVSSVENKLKKNSSFGSFISGGYDSSLISAIGSNLTDKRIETFTIGFNDKENNEAEYVKEIVKSIGIKNNIYYISDKEMKDSVHLIPYAYGEPYADSSQIAALLAYQKAGETCDNVLSGDGGDELFHGYNSFVKVKNLQRILPLLKFTNFFIGNKKLSKSNIVKKISPKLSTAFSFDLSKNCAAQFYKLDALNKFYEIIINEKETKEIKYLFECNYPSHKLNEKLNMIYLQTSLPDDMMVKVYGASNYNKITNYAPLLDLDVVNFSMSIPLKYKFNKTFGLKAIIKDICYDYIPRELLERPKKGFSVPIDRLLRTILWEELMNFSSTNFLNNQNIFNTSVIQNEIENFKEFKSILNGRDIFAFFVFQQWYNEIFL